MNTNTTTIEITIGKETRTVEVGTHNIWEVNGVTRYGVNPELFAVRIGQGAKWHRPTHVSVAADADGKPTVRNAVALNRSASYIGWADMIFNDTTKSNHIGSKIK